MTFILLHNIMWAIFAFPIEVLFYIVKIWFQTEDVMTFFEVNSLFHHYHRPQQWFISSIALSLSEKTEAGFWILFCGPV